MISPYFVGLSNLNDISKMVTESGCETSLTSLRSAAPGGHSGHLLRSASAVPGGLSPGKGSVASSMRKSRSLESLDESLGNIQMPSEVKTARNNIG